MRELMALAAELLPNDPTQAEEPAPLAGLRHFAQIAKSRSRHLPEQEPYDKIAPVGMFEHVGRARLPDYFAKVTRLLSPPDARRTIALPLQPQLHVRRAFAAPMMYRFKSKADADLLMMAPVGDQILALLGREPAAQGIIEASALPAAIESLEKAIAAAEMARQDGRDRDDDENDDRGAVGVGLAQRAWPLLEMMRRSLRERADIVWGV